MAIEKPAHHGPQLIEIFRQDLPLIGPGVGHILSERGIRR